MDIQTFNILDHLDKLEPVKGNRYTCPICQGHNLTINKDSGAYQCWNGCECKEIRDAIAPLSNSHDTPHHQTSKKKSTQKSKPPAPPSVDIHLAKLAAPATDTPQPQKDFDRQHGEILKTNYVYSLTPDGQLERWVVRTDWTDPTKPKGRDKTFRQWHRNASGEVLCKKGDTPWEGYRISEFIQALKTAPGIPAGLVQEGEKAVEASRSIGIASTTLQGSGWKLSDLEQMLTRVKEECPNAVLVFLKDNDCAGEKKASGFQEACEKIGIFYVIINPTVIYEQLEDKGDIVEILAAMDASEFIKRLEEEIHKAVESRRFAERKADFESVDIPDSFDLDIEFTQKALNFLYGDKPWISADDKLYFWTGTYYKCSPDSVERPKIASFCNSYPVQQKDGSIRYPYAKPFKVREALQWVKDRLEVDPSLLNPPGLNCINGVLQLVWNGPQVSWQLLDHDAAHYYTYAPIAVYDPDADPTHCDRMLEVLDAPQREVFLRTIAASLDLTTVRRYKGRLVRGLLLKGCGNNGKDTLRECVAAMYGYQGMTGATLTDFASYDQGRKFPLARLNNSRVNWASENTNTAKLDKIQSLKSFITGDPISIEGKGKDEFEFNPVGVALFNANDTPNLQAALEAITSRYTVLTLSKTFKIGADPSKGELEADPRFKYDPDFLRSLVLPAFLNKILYALTQLMDKGIDYRCTQQALADIQAENSHLFQFCQDVGLGYDPNSSLSIGEIWEKLRQWYIDNGTLAVETSDSGKEKLSWIDQAKKSDPNVKGANQVLARFIQLFPKAKRCRLGNNKVGIQGLAFGISQLATEISQSLASGLATNPDSVRVISQLSQFSNSNEKNDKTKVDPDQRGGTKPEKEKQVEKLPQLANNLDAARDTASLVANEVANESDELANSSLKIDEVDYWSDEQPAIAQTQQQQLSIGAVEAIAADSLLALKIGDSVCDKSGRVMQITKLAPGGWITAESCHVSREELKKGTYTLVEPTPIDLNSAQMDASILIDFASEIDDYAMVRELTQEWTDAHKREVWRLLSPEWQMKYRDLKGKL